MKKTKPHTTKPTTTHERPAPPYARVPVVGVDPGARTTAVVLIGVERPRFVLVENRGGLLLPPVEYVCEVVGTVRELCPSGAVVAVEGVNRPSWHVATRAKRGAASNPVGLLGTCCVVGGLMVAFPDLVVVPPGGNGSSPLGCYPPWLVGPGEKRREGWELRVGTGRFRHGRSAFDIAVRGAGLSSV